MSDDGTPLLTREQILEADDFTSQRVRIPEWKGVVLVRSLTAGERDHFEMTVLGQRARVRALLVQMTLVDEAGKNVFSVDDVEALDAKNGKALDRIFEVAQKINGLGAREIEELEGNFDGALSADSTSG